MRHSTREQLACMFGTNGTKMSTGTQISLQCIKHEIHINVYIRVYINERLCDRGPDVLKMCTRLINT